MKYRMGHLKDWIRLAEEQPSLRLEDLDDEVLRGRLRPGLGVSVFTTEADLRKREDFINYLGTLNRHQLLELNYQELRKENEMYRSFRRKRNV